MLPVPTPSLAPTSSTTSSPSADIQILDNQAFLSMEKKRSVMETMQKPSVAQKKPVITKEACGLCGKMVKGARGLASHNSSCHNCHYCSQAVLDVQEHVRTVHENKLCGHCARRFATQDNLDGHIQEEHLVKCDVCEEPFYSPESMSEHRREEHELEDCDMCEERFLKTEKLLEGHLDKVHGIKTKTIKQFAGGMMFMMAE